MSGQIDQPSRFQKDQAPWEDQPEPYTTLWHWTGNIPIKLVLAAIPVGLGMILAGMTLGHPVLSEPLINGGIGVFFLPVIWLLLVLVGDLGEHPA